MKKIILSLLSVTSFEMATIAMAEDSPFSPAFVLGEQQLISGTALGVGRLTFKPYARFAGVRFAAEDQVDEVFARQSFRLGLAGNAEIGISDTYSDVGSTKFGYFHTVDGFSNPTISARKTWWPEGAVRVNLHGAITPKLGGSELRDISTIYSVGAGAAMITESGLVTSLDVTRVMHDGNGTDSTAVSASVYREFGLYGLSVSGQLQNYNTVSPDIFLGRELVESVNVGVSRKVAENSWLQLAYQYSNSTYQERQIAPNFFNGANIKEDSLQATLRVFF